MLGGENNDTADHELITELSEIMPDLTELAADNRKFQARAVGWLARQGISQFLDLGCGFPASPNTHETARKIQPGARVGYVDWDENAVHAMSAFATPDSGIAAVRADVRDAASVRAAVAGTIDFTEPVAVLMCGLLHFHDTGTARAVVTGNTDGLAPGSYLVALTASGDDATLDRLVRVYGAAVGPIYPHGAAELAGLLGGFDLVPPGVTAMNDWHPGQEAAPAEPVSGITGFGAIARVP